MTDADKLDRIARAICAERCAGYGIPSCCDWGQWPNPNCGTVSEGTTCHTIARAALKAMEESNGKS